MNLLATTDYELKNEKTKICNAVFAKLVYKKYIFPIFTKRSFHKIPP